MRKAYRVTGSTFTHPGELPEGLTVKERLVGDILGTKEYVFHEVKDGSLVIYRQGVPNSNYKLDWDEVQKLAGFLVDMVADKRVRDLRERQDRCNHGEKIKSKCPGTPHRGHSASDWSCPLDRS